MWLYEKHGIWIEARKELTSNEIGVRFVTYIDCVEFNKYTTPTEALLAAIIYTLNNLI